LYRLKKKLNTDPVFGRFLFPFFGLFLKRVLCVKYKLRTLFVLVCFFSKFFFIKVRGFFLTSHCSTMILCLCWQVCAVWFGGLGLAIMWGVRRVAVGHVYTGLRSKKPGLKTVIHHTAAAAQHRYHAHRPHLPSPHRVLPSYRLLDLVFFPSFPLKTCYATK